MSVPLDRLYNFLQGLCNRDIIIYRWTPHGSRKLGDLSTLSLLEVLNKTNVLVTTPPMICHDQEPLNFDYWTQDDFVTYSMDKFFESESVAKQFAHWHLRSALQFSHKAHVFKDTLLCHSELNSKELDKYTQNNFVGVYYWAHALIARDWYRYAQLDQTLKQKNVQSDFLIYNRAWSGTREYRLKFAELLIKSNLHHHCQMGFNDTDGIHYSNHKFNNPAMQVCGTDLDKYFNKNNSLPTASADYCTQDYQQTAIEVVLETLFDDDRLHLTEKSLRPIACGQPFILAATAGSLAYLRSYGFKTFSSVFDESYDTIADPVERLGAIVNLMNNIKNSSNRLEMYQQLQAIADFNQQRFFSSDFHQQVTDEFKQNFSNGFTKVLKSCTPKYMEQYLDAVRSTKDYDRIATKEHVEKNFDALKKYVYDFIDRTTSESNIHSNLPVEESVRNQ
jgi:hypothetical protein